jgi:hypothetical protein
MSDRNEDQSDEQRDDQRDDNTETETILMALDQISQTIDVMTSVVGRLRHFVQEHEAGSEAELREAMHPDRTLH